MSAVVSWPMTDLAAEAATASPAEIGLIPLSDWRAFIQTAMASMLSMLPFAIFIPVAGVHGEESGFGAQWVSLALAMIYAGRIFTIVTVATLQSYAQWQASPLPDVGGFWSVCGAQRWLAWAGDAQVLHLITVSWGVLGAAILLVPAPPAFIAGALCLGVSWAGPLLQIHITRISNGYPNANRQLVTRVWAWRLVGMLLGTSLSGPTYQFLGWPGIMAVVAGSNATYFLLGLLSLDQCRRRAQRGGSDRPRRMAISAGSRRWEQAIWHDVALPSWKQRRSRVRPLIIPAVLLLSCAAVEFALGLLLSTMPLYFREETDSSLLYSAVDMSRVISSLIVLTVLSRLPEKTSMPFQIKLWGLCLLFTGGIITPSFRLLILAVAGHVLCGVAYNLLGPAIHSELILCLKESQLNIWVAMKELVTLACGAAGSAFGTWAFSAGLTGLVFSIPAGVLVLAPVLYTLGHCQAWLKEDDRAAEDAAAEEEEQQPSRRRFSIYPGAVLEDTVASESFIAQEVADGPEGISCLRAKFGFDQNVLFGNLGISSLAIAFQALGHTSVDANKIVNGGKIPVCVAVEQDLSLKHMASLVQHLVLLNGWPLGCVHHMISEHDDFDKFQKLLQEQLTKGVVLVNFEPFFDLSGVGKVKHRGREGWAVAVRMTTKGMIELLVSHGIGGGVHLYAYNAPTAMLWEHCTRISPLSQRPRGVVVLGHAGQGGGALPPPMSSRWSSSECEKALISAAQQFGPVELQQPRNLCQVTSMVLALRFLGVPHISLDAVFSHTSLEISTVVREGLTLADAYGALRTCIESMNLPYAVEPFFPDEEQSVFPDAMEPRNFEAFGKVLGRTIFPQLPVIVNFNCRIAHGAEDDMTMEGGHFAVAIWCDSEVAAGRDGGVLILDPNPARYSRFWFCQASALWRACCDPDSSSGRSRGLLMFEHCLRKSKTRERPASLAATALPTLMQIDRSRPPSVRRGAKLVTL